MIKLSQRIPEVIPNIGDAQGLMNFLTSVKLAVEELARKAKSLQTEIHTSAEPTADDFEAEGEEIRSDISSTRKVHQLLNGSVRSVTVT